MKVRSCEYGYVLEDMSDKIERAAWAAESVELLVTEVDESEIASLPALS